MRYIKGNFVDPEVNEGETIFTNDELLQSKIQEHLEEEDYELEQIKEADSRRFD